MPPREPTADALDAALGRVLAEPPFAGSDDASLSERLARWIDRVWSGLFDDTQGGLDQPLTSLVAVGALIATLSWGVYALSNRLSSKRRPPAPGRDDPSRRERRQAATDPLALARAALGRGETRLCVERLWQGAVHASGASVATGQTPRATLRALRGRTAADAVQVLERLLTAHEHACYAGRSPSVAEAGELLASLERVVARGALTEAPT